MKIVTIGGLPAAGKTYTSKWLAKQYDCMSLEFEPLRWLFLSSDLNKNLYRYTKCEPLMQNESMRDYYLRCTLFESRVVFDDLVKWHKNVMKFSNSEICKTINQFNLINSKNDYEQFCKKYQNLINYMPKYQHLNKELLICSHAFINTINFLESQRIKIDFNSERGVLIKRFRNREKIIGNLTESLKAYYDSYEEVLKDSNSIKLDTNKQRVDIIISDMLSINNIRRR